MPKRQDIQSILIIGAGPIVIGQACEFDYSGVQACRALKQEGYRVILVNSNPATIMTDPELADATYIEPIHWEVLAKIIEKEHPDAILPTMGGQTALNCALDLDREGVLAQFNVEMIGADKAAIDKAEDREKFATAMHKIGLDMPRHSIAHSMEEALQVQAMVGFPCIIRPSFTMGGSGGGIAYNKEEFISICEGGLELSPTHELLIDESLLGWKEFELEVVRDCKDNVIIVCSIENLDPMGVHTGDSITVAPAQTLTDKEYQRMRNAAIKIIREIGVETGGSNVQFGVCPETGRLVVIEMNPRVSRSSALASKATGFPIAKIAAKLAVGYTLDELSNDVTGGLTPASFEPSMDYVVTKIPRFNFDKFKAASGKLTTQMQSVGEVMAIGRTFQESLQKALRGLETGLTGLNPIFKAGDHADGDAILSGELHMPGPDRLRYVADALRQEWSIDDIYALSKIDKWFLAQTAELIQYENAIAKADVNKWDANTWMRIKRKGFLDARIAELSGLDEATVREQRLSHQIKPVFKRVDTCAAEFPTSTAYLYSTYETRCEAKPSNNKKVMILGGGPNRIGQGIEFDYCCVHAAMALREAGYETIMVNCNPETVSTDYDVSDRLYFEALTLEDVLAIVDIEQPLGVIIHYGGQTPLKLANDLVKNGVTILGTSADAIDDAEDRERFQVILHELNLRQPPNGTATNEQEAQAQAEKIGFPLVVRPSYVLGGRAMEIIYSQEQLQYYMRNTAEVSATAPVLLDRYLLEAIEVDVDAVCDGTDVMIAAIMEHIEEAGVHSGDSCCSLPPFSLSIVLQQELKYQMKVLALKLKVKGLVNAQFAIQGDDIYVLEVNPRASRTVPFVSKATGLPLAKIAARVKLGETLKSMGIKEPRNADFFAIKMPVFPFNKFAGVDPVLGPEMKSTGESMGNAKRFGQAYFKAMLAAGCQIERRRKAFVSVRHADKPSVAKIAKRLVDLGFKVVATKGTHRLLDAAGIPSEAVNKVTEGRPHIVDMIKNDEIDFIVNTTDSKQTLSDSIDIRRSAIAHKVSYNTTIAGARASCLAMKYEDRNTVNRIQDLLSTD